jgi:hypothetical protein
LSGATTRNASRERAKHKARNAQARRANHARMMEYLRGQACGDCGIDNPVVLEFHHNDGRKHKRVEVSVLVSHGYSWPRVMAEIAKCMVLCANCHRVRTASAGGYYRSVRRAR